MLKFLGGGALFIQAATSIPDFSGELILDNVYFSKLDKMINSKAQNNSNQDYLFDFIIIFKYVE